MRSFSDSIKRFPLGGLRSWSRFFGYSSNLNRYASHLPVSDRRSSMARLIFGSSCNQLPISFPPGVTVQMSGHTPPLRLPLARYSYFFPHGSSKLSSDSRNGLPDGC